MVVRYLVLAVASLCGMSASGCASTTTVPPASHSGSTPSPREFVANGPEIEDCEPDIEIELSPADLTSVRNALRQVTGNPLHSISAPGNADHAPEGALMVVTRDEGDCGTGSGAVYWARRQGGTWVIQRAKDLFIGWNAVSERSSTSSSAEPHNRALNLTALRAAG